MNDVISHDEQDSHGVFFMERDGARVAEMTYQRIGDARILIDHTQVDVSLRGQGVARRLLDAAVAWARQNNTKISASCSYALARFARDRSISDVRD
jgi:predicted GNAT family acetyltransferase